MNAIQQSVNGQTLLVCVFSVPQKLLQVQHVALSHFLDALDVVGLDDIVKNKLQHLLGVLPLMRYEKEGGTKKVVGAELQYVGRKIANEPLVILGGV